MKSRLFFFILLVSMAYSAPALAAKYKIRWRINHTPEAYFIHAVDVFRKSVESKTNGEVTVVADPASAETTTSPLLLKQVRAGEIEMAQVYTSDIAAKVPAFNIFDLPYLIEDHRHAKRVFEGRVGKNLLGQLTQEKVIGLGFTYSGGFVVRIGKNKFVEKVEDFKGAALKIFNGPFTSLSLKLLGAHIAPDENSNIVSATYADLMGTLDFKKVSPKNYVFNETQDRLLVTTLVINKDFFDRLPSRYQEAVREAAIIAACAERENIVDSGIKIKNEVLKRNFRITKLSKKEKQRWKTKSKSVYSKFYREYPLGSQLVKDIENENELNVANR